MLRHLYVAFCNFVLLLFLYIIFLFRLSEDFFVMSNFYEASLSSCDSEIFGLINEELYRQRREVELIASENIVSRSVLNAMGSVLTNKYAEGYPGRRYYGGCEHVDVVETIAIDRLTRLFDCKFANVQPHSGSQANQAAFMALMSPGDTFMGLSIDSGGHLTHGASPNQSGKWFNAVQYGLRTQDDRIDIDEVASLAREHQPKMILAGGSAYPRQFDFAAFREIADSVGAYLMVDMAHVAGLIAGGVHPSPFPHAHIVTSTTNKTLRGPRGGIILTNDEEISKRVNSSVFPGLQGGPLMHIISAKAVCFGEALGDDFKRYAQSVIENASVLGDVLVRGGLELVSGGTDTHVLLVDLRPKGVTGKAADESLGRANITCNKNGIPRDPEKPAITSGIRLGSPAVTTRGFGSEEMKLVGEYILEVLDGLSEHGESGNSGVESSVAERVTSLTDRFPIYSSSF